VAAPHREATWRAIDRPPPRDLDTPRSRIGSTGALLQAFRQALLVLAPGICVSLRGVPVESHARAESHSGGGGAPPGVEVRVGRGHAQEATQARQGLPPGAPSRRWVFPRPVPRVRPGYRHAAIPAFMRVCDVLTVTRLWRRHGAASAEGKEKREPRHPALSAPCELPALDADSHFRLAMSR
jgi:hypothetical protein